jgi:hypothetical protein
VLIVAQITAMELGWASAEARHMCEIARQKSGKPRRASTRTMAVLIRSYSIRLFFVDVPFYRL